ncbi:molybdopterin molybdotransferase MoeA [Gammaproteobacteria bacterium]|nr:molybdopterin molybdotransferase MoeA [Gammaproteobacteria bacterium]
MPATFLAKTVGLFMAFTGGSLMPIEAALDYLLARLDESPSSGIGTEEVALNQALGSVLAQAQIAKIDVPTYDNSAMDGFAVNSADLKGLETQLSVSQTITAGAVGAPLQANTAARIFTGAPIPQGADAVVIQENTRFDNSSVTILENPAAGKNIRLKGHDIRRGEQVLAAGHKLRPQDMGLLSSLGISSIKIQRPLTVAIINTGDEIISPDKTLGPGQIYDSNSYTLDALLQNLGFKTLKLGIVADDLQSTEQALLEAATKADCIITTGGVSVGDADYVKKAVENLGELKLWKLAIKPGKPFSYGSVNTKPFFGLPGNPVAVFVTFVILVRPYLLKMQGAEGATVTELKVKAGFNITRASNRQEYIRVKLQNNSLNEQELQLFENQGSSIMTSLSWADGLAVVPMDVTIKKGELLSYLPFSGLL